MKKTSVKKKKHNLLLTWTFPISYGKTTRYSGASYIEKQSLNIKTVFAVLDRIRGKK